MSQGEEEEEFPNLHDLFSFPGVSEGISEPLLHSDPFFRSLRSCIGLCMEANKCLMKRGVDDSQCFFRFLQCRMCFAKDLYPEVVGASFHNLQPLLSSSFLPRLLFLLNNTFSFSLLSFFPFSCFPRVIPFFVRPSTP